MSIVRRGTTFHLRKRVPRRYMPVETREFVLLSLHTDSESAAKLKADTVWRGMIDAWEAMLEGDTDDAEARMAAAKELAAKRGYRWMPGGKVAALPLQELLERVEAVGQGRDKQPKQIEGEALLGGSASEKITVSKALAAYWSIEAVKTAGMSKDQVRRWENPRKKAVANFIKVVGDKAIGSITTEDMFRFREWWGQRIIKGEAKKSSANKDFIHLTAMLKAVARARDVKLKFSTEKLNFQQDDDGTRPPFSTSWIKDKLLAPGALDGLNGEARGILLAMVNTGARPSEIAMLTEAQIKLAAPIPHIKIEAVGRNLKSAYAKRTIPLTGVSLEAFRANPKGFPRYADNPALSDTVNKFLRENKLLESPDHSLYSLRHAFEDRLLAAGVDNRIHADLMGHRIDRERYGAGASLEHVHGLLLPIAI